MKVGEEYPKFRFADFRVERGMLNMRKYTMGVVLTGILGVLGVIATVGWSDNQWHEVQEVYIYNPGSGTVFQRLHDVQCKISSDGVVAVKSGGRTIYHTHISNVILIQR